MNMDGCIDFKTTRYDLQRFQALTVGYPVVMGINTWLSLPKERLPERECVVLSRNTNPLGADYWRQDLKEAMEEFSGGWLIGGAEIYNQGINDCDMVYMSLYYNTHGGEKRVTAFNAAQWDMIVKQKFDDHFFMIYAKK